MLLYVLDVSDCDLQAKKALGLSGGLTQLLLVAPTKKGLGSELESHRSLHTHTATGACH